MKGLWGRGGGTAIGWRQWFDARAMALALVAAGIGLPLVVQAFRPGLQPLAQAAGSAIVAAGLLLLAARADREAGRRLDAMLAGVHGLAERVERLGAGSELVKNDVTALGKRLEGEQRNLGMVAGGLGEMRQIVRLERQNLGMVADSVEEIREALRTFHDALDGVATRVDAVLARQDDMGAKLQVQQRNLGMVAGALDDVRRQAAGVDRFDARQAAFEDTLIAMADRIDRVGADAPPAASPAPDPEAGR